MSKKSTGGLQFGSGEKVSSRAVTVFCGSNVPKIPAFMTEVKRLGEELAKGGFTLVYGGAAVGTMGALADAALGVGGRVVGVIPKVLLEKEVAHSNLTHLYQVGSMHERKQKMFDLCDAFIVLPGGFGTLDEMFEIVTWSQIGIHRKPVVLMNLLGFYDDLISFLHRAVELGYIQEQHFQFLQVVSSVGEALSKIDKI